MNEGPASPSEPEQESSRDSYSPHRSSLKLRKSISMEMLALFEPYLRRIAAKEWRRSLEFRESISDLVQESLTAGVRDFTAFEGKTEGELAAWLRRILFRIMQGKLRKYKTRKADLTREAVGKNVQEIEGNEPTPSAVMNQIEQRIKLEIALQQLAEHYRHVIELHHIEGLTFAEIGLQIEKTAEAVRKIWVRGLVSLQEKLGELPSSGRTAR
jgi:RNA polymerase sigma-70 factor, ECF subfamily